MAPISSWLLSRAEPAKLGLFFARAGWSFSKLLTILVNVGLSRTEIVNYIQSTQSVGHQDVFVYVVFSDHLMNSTAYTHYN